MTRDLTHSRARLWTHAWNQARTVGIGWDGIAHPEASEFSDAISRSLPEARELVVVIDLGDRLDDHQDVLTDLLTLVERHHRLHLVMISRGPHPIQELAVGAIELNVIESAELMLTLSEIGDLAATIGVDIDQSQARLIHDTAGGWIAPVRLILHDTARTAAWNGELSLSTAQRYLQRTLHETLRETLRKTVFSTMSHPAALDRLQRLSLSHDLDPDVAGVILAHDAHDAHHADVDPAALLRDLEDSGLVQHQHRERDQRSVVALPHLVRSSLRDAFTRAHPEAARAVHRRLAHWYVGDPGEAGAAAPADRPVDTLARHMATIEHVAAAQEWDLADESCRRHGTALTFRFVSRMQEALSATPPEVLEAYPRLRVTRAFARMRAAQVASAPWVEHAHDYFRTCTHILTSTYTLAPPDLVPVATGRLLGLQHTGRLREAAEFGARIQANVREADITDRAGQADQADRGQVEDDALAWFLLHLGSTHLLVGQNQEAADCYQRIWDQRSSINAGHILRSAAMTMAMIHAHQGNRHHAQAWLDRGRLHDPDPAAAASASSAAEHVATSILTLDHLGDHAAAEELWLEHEDRSVGGLWPFLAFAHAQRGLHLATPVATLGRLDTLEAAHDRLVGEGSIASLLMTRARADLLIAAGEGERARQLLNAYAAPNPRIATTAQSFLAVPRTRIHLLAGNHAATTRLARSTAARRNASPRVRQELELIAAVACLRLDDRQQAARHMRETLALHKTTHALSVFATIEHDDLHQLLTLADASLPPGEAARLASRQPVYPTPLELIRLTKREKAILEAMRDHDTCQAIAAALFVSPNTVKYHQKNLYRKLRANSRAQALEHAHDLNLLASAADVAEHL